MVINVVAVQVDKTRPGVVRVVVADETQNFHTHILLTPDEAHAMGTALIRSAEEAKSALVIAGTMPAGKPGKA